MNFTFDKRGDPSLVSLLNTSMVKRLLTLVILQLDDLGQAIANVSNVTPDGIVCFLPSYAYLDQVAARWEQTGMMAKLALKKKVRVILSVIDMLD